jgi:hypothetical protein
VPEADPVESNTKREELDVVSKVKSLPTGVDADLQGSEGPEAIAGPEHPTSETAKDSDKTDSGYQEVQDTEENSQSQKEPSAATETYSQGNFCSRPAEHSGAERQVDLMSFGADGNGANSTSIDVQERRNPTTGADDTAKTDAVPAGVTEVPDSEPSPSRKDSNRNDDGISQRLHHEVSNQGLTPETFDDSTDIDVEKQQTTDSLPSSGATVGLANGAGTKDTPGPLEIASNADGSIPPETTPSKQEEAPSQAENSKVDALHSNAQGVPPSEPVKPVENPEESLEESGRNAIMDEPSDSKDANAAGIGAAVVAGAGAGAAYALWGDDKGTHAPTPPEAIAALDGNKTVESPPTENEPSSLPQRRPTVSHSSTQTEDDFFKVQSDLVVPTAVDPRSSTPGVVIPDAEMVNMHRARTLRRKRKMSLRHAEDTVAAAVVIYATADALSPPASPSLASSPQNDKDLPSLDHQLSLEGEKEEEYVLVSGENITHGSDDLHKSVADFYTDDRARDSDSSRSDKDRERERHRRRRHSSNSTHSGRSRGEEEVADSRRRSSQASHSSHAHRRREESGGSSPSKTPPRTPRRDSGFSGDGSASSGRKRRTPEEQADHERRKAERRAKEKEQERHDSPRSRPSHSREPEEGERRRHRSTRRPSHSSHHSRPEPPREEPPFVDDDVPEKRFFDIKNAEGVLASRSGTSTPTRNGTPTAESGTRTPPRVDTSKRPGTARSKHSSTRRSTDETARPRSSKRREEAHVAASSNSKSSRSPPEDAARRARHQERKKAKEEEKKPGGIKGMFRRLFTSS